MNANNEKTQIFNMKYDLRGHQSSHKVILKHPNNLFLWFMWEDELWDTYEGFTPKLFDNVNIMKTQNQV